MWVSRKDLLHNGAELGYCVYLVGHQVMLWAIRAWPISNSTTSNFKTELLQVYLLFLVTVRLIAVSKRLDAWICLKRTSNGATARRPWRARYSTVRGGALKG